jgi:hypothetical protein
MGQTQGKRPDRRLAMIAVLGIAAALIYKFVWPWTSLCADLSFRGITLAGIFAMSRLEKKPCHRAYGRRALQTLEVRRAGGHHSKLKGFAILMP